MVIWLWRVLKSAAPACGHHRVSESICRRLKLHCCQSVFVSLSVRLFGALFLVLFVVVRMQIIVVCSSSDSPPRVGIHELPDRSEHDFYLRIHIRIEFRIQVRIRIRSRLESHPRFSPIRLSSNKSCIPLASDHCLSYAKRIQKPRTGFQAAGEL